MCCLVNNVLESSSSSSSSSWSKAYVLNENFFHNSAIRTLKKHLKLDINMFSLPMGISD
jgi:hypothetical protein